MKLPPTPPTDGVLKSLGHLVRKSEGDASGKPVFRITSEVLDRHNDRVRAGALRTEAYNANPVLLWNHEHGVPAIGTARVFQEGEEWFMEPAFDGIGDLSKEVGAKVEARTLRTCSIFFRFSKYEPNAEGGLDYEECELLEVSITNIPANPEACRVKNQGQTKKNDAPTPPPEEAGKDAEGQDLGALLDEKLSPLVEALGKLTQALAAKAEEPAEDPTDTEEEAGKGDDEPPAPPAEAPTEAKSLKRFRSPFVCG
ncbi:putative caudovirus prohead protease [Cystobacter fuscus DSM 2262]|uniref:Caudovirus prohead protease n=1 Tax=Cystobacter fuscus (strain ATCC 25194 / DSM 2262 / NBRC 100088 / M29) TaxID=1242864 RepID=S9PDU3_CYSF2|nr:HK97 family phage prohead protease [Cystobacter fuscus]EPX62540.1 putative caudovirus prohead protease [Cystobacter fuscus DSM 2262]